MKQVTYTRTALKALKKIAAKDRDAIMDKLKNYADGGMQDFKALAGSNYLRLRHGNWRAVFTEDGKVIDVHNVAKRGEVYR